MSFRVDMIKPISAQHEECAASCIAMDECQFTATGNTNKGLASG